MIRQKEKVLVTGAAGFIGSATCARLNALGFSVVGCDNFNSYYSPQLKRDRVDTLLKPYGVRCLPIDIADAAAVQALFEIERPTMVVHLAAQAGVRYSLENPSAYIQSNLVGFHNVLDASHTHEVRHMVYASSSSVYGANAKLPFDERDRTDHPVSLYAATKKANELMAYSYSHLYGMALTGLRFFTVYGPMGRPDMAYFSFTKKILAGERIPVFAEGKLERDFTYIDDIVEGVVRVLQKPQVASEGIPPSAVFNIGNHRPVRVMDFIHTLERALDCRAKIDFLPMQPGDVPATYAETEQLRDWVGFTPSTPLEEGLSRFCAWYRHWAGSPVPPKIENRLPNLAATLS